MAKNLQAVLYDECQVSIHLRQVETHPSCPWMSMNAPLDGFAEGFTDTAANVHHSSSTKRRTRVV